MRDKAAQLEGDITATELGRLSENTNSQPFNDPGGAAKASPPQPWRVLSNTALLTKGISPQLLQDARAVIYQLPPDFPFDPKTVLAFRGTTTADSDDILANHDQAVGLKSKEYTAAETLGQLVHEAFPSAQVTGHSLGGGKAQAAGVMGHLSGIMFNSAGLNPATVGLSSTQLQAFSDRFIQYRAEGGLLKLGGDPLTAIQNSPALQKVVFGTAAMAKAGLQVDSWARDQVNRAPWEDRLPPENQGIAGDLVNRLLNVSTSQLIKNHAESGGHWYIPPAVGAIKGVASKNADGTDASASPLEQHSMGNLVNGLEYRKFNNINDLLKATGSRDAAAAYTGRTDIIMR